MTHPDQHGDQGARRGPRSGYQYQPSEYQRDPYQRDPYQRDPYQRDPYQRDPYQRDPYQRDPYQRDPYQRDPYQRDPYQRDPRQGAHSPPQDRRPSGEVERSGGAEGNERLTVMTGAVLLILLAVEGLTILRIGRLLTLHIFLGMLLLGPVALKAGSVIYRFSRYYTGSSPYRRKGPPAPLLRVIGPVILLLTACVFGSGIMLAIVGPSGEQPWLTVHRGTFILWFAAMTIHVLAYVPRLPRRLYAEARGVTLAEGGSQERTAHSRHAARAAQILGGRGVRLSLLIASLAAGLVIALLTVHLAGAWESPARFLPSLTSPRRSRC